MSNDSGAFPPALHLIDSTATPIRTSNTPQHADASDLWAGALPPKRFAKEWFISALAAHSRSAKPKGAISVRQAVVGIFGAFVVAVALSRLQDKWGSMLRDRPAPRLSRTCQLSEQTTVEWSGTDVPSNITRSSSAHAAAGPLFVHIPKAAGTSVEAWGLVQNPPRFFGASIDFFRQRRPWRNTTAIPSCIRMPARVSFEGDFCDHINNVSWNGTCCSWWHIPPKLFSDFPASHEFFVIVRDPIERAISEVHYMGVNMSCDDNTYDAKVREKVLESMQDPYVADCHWLPQMDYVTDSKGQLLENAHIIPITALAQGMRSLFPEFSTFPKDRKNAQKECKGVVLSAATTRLLRERYARDFELLANATAQDHSLNLWNRPPPSPPPPTLQ